MPGEGGIAVGLLYRTWFGLTGWLLAAVLCLFVVQGQVVWWQPAALWTLFAVLWFVTRTLGADPGALPVAAVLVFCGWLFLTRLDPAFSHSHSWGVLLGGLLYLFGLLVPVTGWPLTRLWGGAALALLAVTALWGEASGGARAWLTVHGVRFQPVELAKVFFVLYLGKSLSRKRPSWEPVLFLGGFCLLLAWQRDLGPAVLMFLVFCWLLLQQSFSWYKLLACTAAALVGFYGSVRLFTHVENRVLAWLKPWEYLESKGYQVVQGLFALGAGGLVGQGLGQSLVHVIPQAHTDYLLAVVGEEFGFLGVCALLICYFGLAFWALRIADGLAGEEQVIALGLTLLQHLQVFLVVGGMLRLVPFTGLTLPLVSYGSTSIGSQLWMLGLLAGLSRRGGQG